MNLCKAAPPKSNGTAGPNYDKPHVWISGTYDGQRQDYCRFCGVTRTMNQLFDELEGTKIGSEESNQISHKILEAIFDVTVKRPLEVQEYHGLNVGVPKISG